MTGVPRRGNPDEDPGPVTGAKQADAGRLLAVVLTATSNMRAALADQESAREGLLESLGAYTSGLAARGLSAPSVLRDELTLQRNLAGRVT